MRFRVSIEPTVVICFRLSHWHVALAMDTALQFQYKKFLVKVDGNPYAGNPRPELDAAWHELFEGTRSSN